MPLLKTMMKRAVGFPSVKNLIFPLIDAPAMERRLNFHPEQVKLVKDMDSHITYCYRIKPEIDNL